MFVNDPAGCTMSRSEKTRAWYADQLMTLWGRLRRYPWAKELGVKGRHTVCAKTQDGFRYVLLDSAEPYDGRPWASFERYLEDMVQEMGCNQFSYQNFVEDPDVRAWCRGIRHDGFESELVFKMGTFHNAMPAAMLTVNAPTRDFGHDLPAQGFAPYTGETWIMAF